MGKSSGENLNAAMNDDFDDIEDDGYMTMVDSELEEDINGHGGTNARGNHDFEVSDDEFEKN